METETNIPDDASAMSKAPEDKHSLASQFDSIRNQCEIDGSIKPSCGVSQHLQRFEYTAEAEEMQKGDNARKIMITSATTQEDKISAESSSHDKPSTENVSELGYSHADIIVNQQPKPISENETEYQKGIESKDIEMGGHKTEVINNTNIEEYDHDIENEEVLSPTQDEEPHLKVHEQESPRDNSNSSHDQHLEAISNQHAPIEVISETREKQTIASQTNENKIPKEKEDADLEYNEQATSLFEANLGLINELLILNLELETKNLYKDDERVTEAGVKDEDMDSKCNSNSTTHIEDKNRDISLIGVQNKKAEMSYVQEGEEQEERNVPALDTGEKSEIKDGPQIIQGEATEIELAVEKQLQETTTESVPEQEASSTVPTSAIVKDGIIEKTIQEQTHEEEESTMIDDDKSCTSEIEHEQAAKVFEAIDQLKTMSKVHAENEEHADQKSEAQISENMITKHVDSDEMGATENIEKSSYDVKELEQTMELPSAENREINDGGNIMLEEAIGVPEGQTLQHLPTIESVIFETFDKSIQEEIHKDAESAVTDIEKGQTYANEIEDKTNVLEALELHEVNGSTSKENEKKAEPQSEASLDTIILKHPDLERLESTERNPSNDTEEQENVPPSDAGEKSDIKDGPQIIQEEAKEIELATEKQSPETATESVLEKDAPSTMSTATRAVVQSGTVEKTIQKLTHEEDEPTLIDDDKSCTQENEHELETKVLEAIDLPETMSEVSAENEENADQKSKEQSSDGEKWMTNHINTEEMVTTESIEKSSHHVKELKKTRELHYAENRDIDDIRKITPEEAVGVPEGQTLQPLPTLASTGVQTVDKSIQEGIHKDGKSAVTDRKEEQTHEEEFVDKTIRLEAFTASLDTTVLKHPHLEGSETTEIKLSNDTEEQENGPASEIGEKLEIKDGPKIIQEEAKEMELATEIQLPETVTETVPEDQTLQPPPTIESVLVETIDKRIQEEIHKDGKSAMTDTEEGQTHENDFEAYALHEVIASTTKENEKKAEPKSETSLESTVLKHSNLEGLKIIEINPCNDTEELENLLASDTVEKLEIKDDSQRIQEEAKEMELEKEMTSVNADQTLPSLPNIASIGVETVNKSFQEEIQKIDKSTVTYTKERQKQENDFEDKTIVHEAFELDKVVVASVENEKKDEPRSEASMETIVLKQPSLEVLETTEINQSNEIEEQENVLASDTGEKLEIKDGPQIIKEEAKDMELATENQLPESATECLAVQEALSTMPPLDIVEGGMIEKIIEERTHEKGESTPKDDDKSCTPENEHDQATKVLEEIVLPETMNKVSAENEEHADEKSESQSRENVITKHVDSEEVATMESIEKSSYDIREVEMAKELPSAKYQEINDCGKITPDEALGVPQDQTLQPLPSIASIGVETGDRSIHEEIHTHVESIVIDTEEGQTHENESEDKIEVIEAFDLRVEIACNKVNRKKAELRSDASLGKTVLQNPNLEGLETTKLHPSIDTEEPENVSVPDTGEELEIKDYAHIIQEEEKRMELATERQLLDAATESVPEQEAPSTMPTSAIVEGGMIEKIIQEQTHEEEEPTPIDDDKSCTRENEHEQATEVLEAIDLPKTASKASVENEEHVDQKSEGQSSENMITKHIDLEEMMTKERIKISSYDVNDLEKTQELPSSENREINDGRKNMPEEAIGVPEDQTLQPLPTIESVIDEAVDKSIEEEIHKDGESAMTDTKEGQTHENEFVDKMNVLEEFELHEVTSSTSKENEKKVESQSESRHDTTVIKHMSLEGLETIEINPSIETKEPEKIPVSDTGEKLEIKDGAKILQEDANVMELEPEKQLPEAQTASVNEQEPLSKRPTLVIVEGGTLEKIIQEQRHEEEESTPIDDNKSNTPENKHEQESKVLEEIDLPKTMSMFSAENEEHADQKLEGQCSDVVAKLPKHTDSEEMMTIESIEKSTYDVKILDKTLELPSAENQEINDGKLIGMPEDQILQSPPTIACVGVDTVDKSIQEEVHKDNESAVTKTEEEHMHENEYEEKTNALEAFDLHEVIASTSEENEEKSEPQLEASLDTTVLRHPDLEGLETTEINLSNDTEKPENVQASNTGDKIEIKDGCEIIQEKAKEMELATEKSLMGTTTESVPEQEALSTMPTPAIPEGGMLEKIIQEQTHEEEESPLKDDDKSYARKNEHEQATKVLEAIELPATMSKVSAENEEHPDQKSEAQITTESIEKSTYDVKLLDKTLELPSPENREINESRKITPEKAIGVPQDQTLQPLPTIASVGVETIVRSIQEEIHKDDESAVTSTEDGQTYEKKFVDKMMTLLQTHKGEESPMIDNDKSCRPENEIEQTSKVLEHMLTQVNDLPKTMCKVGTENEEHNNHQYEAQSVETMIFWHTNSERTVTTKSSPQAQPSYDMEEQEKIPESHSVKNSEIKGCGKSIPKEAREIKEPTTVELQKSEPESVPEDRSLSTFPTIESVKCKTAEKNPQEEIAVIDTNQGQRPEKEIEDNTEVLEAFCLHKATGNTYAGNEKMVEPQSQAQSSEIMFVKNPKVEGLETSEIIQNNDSEKLEKVPSTHTGEELEIEDGAKIIKDGEKEMEEVTVMQFLNSAKESVPEDEAQSALPTSEFVKGETVEKSFPEQTLMEAQSTVIDNDMSCRPENELEQTTEVLEPRENITGGNFQDGPQRETEMQFEDEHHVPGTKLIFINQIEDVDLAEVRKFETGENLAMPNEEFSSCTTMDASEGQQSDESNNTLYRTSSTMPHGVEKEDKDESFNKNDIKNIFERNDARTTESSIVNTILDTIDNGGIHQENSKLEKRRETCGNENIEEQTIHSENVLVENKISFPREGILNQVEDHNVKNFKATDSNEQREIMDLSFENDPARKEATPRDSDEAIESEAIGKLEIQEAETHQIGSAKEYEGDDEFEKISPSSSGTVMIKGSQDSDVKVSPKKTHGILSGVGSKVKHSISKVKKAITGKSSHSKTSLPK